MVKIRSEKSNTKESLIFAIKEKVWWNIRMNLAASPYETTGVEKSPETNEQSINERLEHLLGITWVNISHQERIWNVKLETAQKFWPLIHEVTSQEPINNTIPA